MKEADLAHLKARLDLQCEWDEARDADAKQRAEASFLVCEEWLLEFGDDKVAALKATGHL